MTLARLGRPTVWLLGSLGLYTLSGLLAVAVAGGDDPDRTRQALATGVLIALVLGYFLVRGHRWPRWILLGLLVLALVGAGASGRPVGWAIGALDVAALALLLAARPRRGPGTGPTAGPDAGRSDQREPEGPGGEAPEAQGPIRG